MLKIIPYPNNTGLEFPPQLTKDPITLHTFPFGWSFWLPIGNQVYEREYRKAVKPIQYGNMNAFKKILGFKANGVILDVGGNIGMMAHHFATWGATVHCFEPTPKLIEMAAHNLVINGTANQVTLYQNAVSEACKPVVFTDYRRNGHVNALVNKPEIPPKQGNTSTRFNVDAITLDSCNFEHVDGIKIDVEGLEYKVILGAINLITRDRPVIMIEIMEKECKGYKPQDIYDFFLKLGYAVYDKGTRKKSGYSETPRYVGEKWTYEWKMSDKIFVPKEKQWWLSDCFEWH